MATTLEAERNLAIENLAWLHWERYYLITRAITKCSELRFRVILKAARSISFRRELDSPAPIYKRVPNSSSLRRNSIPENMKLTETESIWQLVSREFRFFKKRNLVCISNAQNNCFRLTETIYIKTLQNNRIFCAKQNCIYSTRVFNNVKKVAFIMSFFHEFLSERIKRPRRCEKAVGARFVFVPFVLHFVSPTMLPIPTTGSISPLTTAWNDEIHHTHSEY